MKNINKELLIFVINQGGATALQGGGIIVGEEEFCDGVGYQVVQGHGVGGGGAGRPVTPSLLCHPLEVSGPFIMLFPRNQKTF